MKEEKSVTLKTSTGKCSVRLHFNYLEEFSNFSKNFESRAPKQKEDL